MNDLFDELYKIQYFLKSYPDYLPIIGGVFIVGWSRDSSRTQCSSDFVESYNLRCIGLDTRFNIDYTYQFSMERFSVIDQFLMLQHNFEIHSDIVNNLFADHHVDNCSDHDPLFLDLNIDISRIDFASRVIV